MADISIDKTGNLYINGHWVYINKNDELSFMKIDNITYDKPKQTVVIKNQQLKAKLIDDDIDSALHSGDGNNFIGKHFVQINFHPLPHIEYFIHFLKIRFALFVNHTE